MEILSQHITCTKTLKLIKSGLKAGFVDDMGKLHENITGTLQGSVLSLLLCNIYLNELDNYIIELMKSINENKKRQYRTSEY